MEYIILFCRTISFFVLGHGFINRKYSNKNYLVLLIIKNNKNLMYEIFDDSS
jgi:hypothetical protein